MSFTIALTGSMPRPGSVRDREQPRQRSRLRASRARGRNLADLFASTRAVSAQPLSATASRSREVAQQIHPGQHRDDAATTWIGHRVLS